MAIFGRRARTAAATPKAVAVPVSAPGNKTAAVGSDSVNIALGKQRGHLESLRYQGIIVDNETEEHQAEVRRICRDYAKYHDLIPIILTVYARFPLQGMRIKCLDDEMQEAFEHQFFDVLDYKNFLVDVGMEYFTTGEVTTFGSWDDQARQWLNEEILNPDTIHVERSVFVGEDRVSMDVSDSLNEVISNPGSDDYIYLNEVYPDLAEAARAHRPVNLDPEGVWRMANKAAPWDLRGTPLMTRVFRSLLQEESLNAAQDAVADRLYSPLVLAKIGIPASDMGQDNQGPWIPTEDQLNSFAETMNVALAADFRLIVHHFGIDIRNVFGRESVPRFDNDFDRLEKKIMRAFGLGSSILEGSSGGPYASSAINRDFVTQLMSSYQEGIKKLFAKRARKFAESRGIYEYELDANNSKKYVEETVGLYDEDGNPYSEKRKKVFVPEIEFSSSPMKDVTSEMNLLMQLKNAGVPISNDTMIAVSDMAIDFDNEIVRIQDEETRKSISEATVKKQIAEELVDAGVEEEFSPDELKNDAGEQFDDSQAGSEDLEPDSYSPSEEE